VGEIQIKLEVHGKEGLDQLLERMKEAVKPPKLTESVEKGADVFVEGEKARAPFDTGDLKNSIHKERGTDGDASFIIEPEVEYAVYQEYGAHGHPLMTFQYHGQWYSMHDLDPQPFVKPTFEEDVEKAAAAVIADVIKNIRG
jgi:HK97 gp10 family phage protein